ncbi:helix-hairpin-helix domain-containing protein [Kocuria sabuli]|uniref:helix-hairpin-helix domain-containing protein n=1 Tax=Kocuria sabuli TaxID=3071448 RepID=UPI0034D3A0DC
MTGTVPRDRHRASSNDSTAPGRPRTPRPGAPAERLAALLAEAAPGTAPGDPADAGSTAGLRTAGPAGTAGRGTAAETGSTPGGDRSRRSGADGPPGADPAHRWETTARTRVPSSLLLLATAAVAGLAWFVLGPGAPDDGAGEDGGAALAEVGVPAPDAAGPAPGAAASGAAQGAAASATAPPATEGSLHVHVAGEVARPGVVELEPGARVVDAVEAAGGLTDAAAGTVNLAAPVTDGQQVLVPDAAAPAPGPAPAGAAAGPAAGSAAGEAGAAGGAVPGGPLNLNTATAADLEALPRVGPVLAGRIVEFRDQHGGFTTAGDLDAVPGIGPALMEALLPLVTV